MQLFILSLSDIILWLFVYSSIELSTTNYNLKTLLDLHYCGQLRLSNPFLLLCGLLWVGYQETTFHSLIPLTARFLPSLR